VVVDRDAIKNMTYEHEENRGDMEAVK
jgi:hypothetical protein